MRPPTQRAHVAQCPAVCAPLVRRGANGSLADFLSPPASVPLTVMHFGLEADVFAAILSFT